MAEPGMALGKRAARAPFRVRERTLKSAEPSREASAVAAFAGFSPYPGTRLQKAATSRAHRATRRDNPAGSTQAGPFLLLNSHQPKQRMKRGMVTKVVVVT